MSRRTLPLLVAMITGLLLAPLSAHDVIVEQVVAMSVEPNGEQLLIRLHVPLTVLGDAKLPRVLDRTIDADAVGGPLRIVAGDIAHNLDVQQADTELAAPLASARVGDDGASIDVELQYAARTDAAGFSARLNAFNSNDGPVRSTVHYRLPTGHDNIISITGPPVRVLFDPTVTDVLQQFTARGLRALVDGGDHLLFLVCVLLPIRRARSVTALVVAAVLGQMIAIGLSLLRSPMTADSLTTLSMIAASAVVAAALQSVVRAHLRWVVALALVFGVLNGFAFGNALILSEQFAGSHVSMAVAAFAVVALPGELWFGALAWVTRTWLNERGMSERLVSIGASVIIVHTAIHRVGDRGHLLAEAGSFGAERAIVWLVLGWAAVMIVIAIAAALTDRTLDSGDPGHTRKAASTA